VYKIWTKNSQPFGKKCQKTSRGFLTHTVDRRQEKLKIKQHVLFEHGPVYVVSSESKKRSSGLDTNDDSLKKYQYCKRIIVLSQLLLPPCIVSLLLRCNRNAGWAMILRMLDAVSRCCSNPRHQRQRASSCAAPASDPSMALHVVGVALCLILIPDSARGQKSTRRCWRRE